ncbi:hypothetical protein ACHAO8_002616 [Botrytis cinerea]
MYFPKAAITAILASTLVQGVPTEKRCDTCGLSDKESKIEERGFPKLPIIRPFKTRFRPLKDFCDKCPPREFFEAGGAGHGMTPEGMMGEFVTGLCNDHCGTAYNQSEPNVLHYDVLISPTDANAILPEVITSKVESNAIKPEVTASKSASQEDHENKSDENKNKKHTIRFEADDIIEFKGTEEGTCTTEGMFNCISGTSFQQCASGGWSAVQNMAEGTVCLAGQAYDLNTVAVKKRTAEAQDIQNSTSDEMEIKKEQKPAEKRVWIQIFHWNFGQPAPAKQLSPKEKEVQEIAAKIKHDKEFHQYGGHGDLKKEAEEKKAEKEKESHAFSQFGTKEDGENQE